MGAAKVLFWRKTGLYEKKIILCNSNFRLLITYEKKNNNEAPLQVEVKISVEGKVDVSHHIDAQTTTPSPAAPTFELSNSQLVLAFDCFLRYISQQQGGELDKTTLARFMHMTSAKLYSSVHNSDLYYQLRRLPKLLGKNTKDKQRLYQYFEAFELPELSRVLASIG